MTFIFLGLGSFTQNDYVLHSFTWKFHNFIFIAEFYKILSYIGITFSLFIYQLMNI